MPDKVVKNRVHPDVRSPDGRSMEAEVARLEGVGARQQRLVWDDEFCVARC